MRISDWSSVVCSSDLIGPGAGMLMQELSARGFTCHALETSPPAHQLIWALSARYGHQLDLHDAPAAEWQQRFPLVMAFEVLEHIEDDHAALDRKRTRLNSSH